MASSARASCARCKCALLANEVKAYIYARILCASCWRAWDQFQSEAFRVFMGETATLGEATVAPPQPG